jgi:hypothetical protein
MRATTDSVRDVQGSERISSALNRSASQFTPLVLSPEELDAIPAAVRERIAAFARDALALACKQISLPEPERAVAHSLCLECGETLVYSLASNQPHRPGCTVAKVIAGFASLGPLGKAWPYFIPGPAQTIAYNVAPPQRLPDTELAAHVELLTHDEAAVRRARLAVFPLGNPPPPHDPDDALSHLVVPATEFAEFGPVPNDADAALLDAMDSGWGVRA